MMTRIHNIVAIALVLALSAPAYADDASTLKATGDTAFDALRYGEALEAYQGALAKNRDARLHYNIAQSLSALERYPEALASYQAFIAEAPAGTMTEQVRSALFELLEKLKAKIARLEVTCDVPGARVLVRGKTVGTTPLASGIVLNAGEAKVEVLAEGYKPFESTLSLTGGATRPLAIVLQRVDFRGGLAVSSNVAGAQVFVDGAPQGFTPFEVRMERGSHVVEVKAEGHVAHREVVKVEAGKKSDVKVRLERAPNYTLAYVGFGIGAVGIAAGATSGILSFTTFSKAKENCDTSAKECGPAGQSDLQSSRTWSTVSNVGFGVGLAGIALGTYGLLTAKPGKRESAVNVTLYPGGAGVFGRF
jgi:hypothetical protein